MPIGLYAIILVMPLESSLRTRSPEKFADFHIPNYQPTIDAFAKEFPEAKEALETTLDEFERQALKNIGVFSLKEKDSLGREQPKSEVVSFPYTTVKVNREIILRLGQKLRSLGALSSFSNLSEDNGGPLSEPDSAGPNDRQRDYFLFTAFAPPPEGHPFTLSDVAIDRFIRVLIQVADPLSRRELSPEVTIHLMGAPTGVGGTVTPAWIEHVKSEGLDAHAELYAAYINEHAPANLANAHIVLQGVSKGALIAEKTSHKLSKSLRGITQNLLDNPAGHHTPGIDSVLKGGQVAAGLAVETATRLLLDESMMKPIQRGGKGFIRQLSARMEIDQDTPEQLALKREAAIAEGLVLIKGSPIDTEGTRSYIRSAVYDPLAFRWSRLFRQWNGGKGLAGGSQKIGKSIEIPFYGSHFFFYRSYRRWATILSTLGKLELNPGPILGPMSSLRRAHSHVALMAKDPFWGELSSYSSEELSKKLDSYETEIVEEHKSVGATDMAGNPEDKEKEVFDELCARMLTRIQEERSKLHSTS